jgi:Ca2+-binding EF-hand superfamily protein
LDTNDDGAISVKELDQVLQKYQIEHSSVSGLHKLITVMQKDPEMEISLSKFREYVEPILKTAPKACLNLRPVCRSMQAQLKEQ